VSESTLESVFESLASVPEGFNIHPKLQRQFDARSEMFREGHVDWALGEALAYGTLLDQGISVRLAGQDSGRGTFSQRHAVLVDYETGERHTPLEHTARDGAHLWLYDSLLSEYAALGFEYGYSVSNQAALVCWEAQFGDFMNGAQIIIDQFIVASEDKWNQSSGLVMLLPHGYEGQGPEHSSARIERFLILAAEDNIQAVNATTAAQYFHVLRRQMVREVRKPLVIFTPKSLLRAKTTRSPIADLTSGSFEEVLDDPTIEDPLSVRRVVFGSGKIAVEAVARRDDLGAPAAVVRIEQLYPWPFEAIAEVLDRYSEAREIVWLQEEPDNMGAWTFARTRLEEPHGNSHQITAVTRSESGSPATGANTIHKQEQDQLLTAAFTGL
jgi:2-oxoglutarate dehydrogenase E1 component